MKVESNETKSIDDVEYTRGTGTDTTSVIHMLVIHQFIKLRSKRYWQVGYSK